MSNQEAQATSGDSGGAAFEQIGGNWYLVGLIDGFGECAARKPIEPTTSNNVWFNEQSVMADLAPYQSTIAAIVPEPSGLVLGGVGAAVALLAGLRARREAAAPEPAALTASTAPVSAADRAQAAPGACRAAPGDGEPILRVPRLWTRGSECVTINVACIILGIVSFFCHPRHRIGTDLTARVGGGGMVRRNSWSRGGRASAGFTLVELLVVISIIAMLMALLLPAVQIRAKARRRNTCQNNQHNISFALMTYNDSKKVLSGLEQLAQRVRQRASPAPISTMPGSHVYRAVASLYGTKRRLPKLYCGLLEFDALACGTATPTNCCRGLPIRRSTWALLVCPSNPPVSTVGATPLAYVINGGQIPVNDLVPAPMSLTTFTTAAACCNRLHRRPELRLTRRGSASERRRCHRGEGQPGLRQLA